MPSPSAFQHRALVGGVFGIGRYALSTLPSKRRGLNTVRFVVINPAAGQVVSVADSQIEAVAAARDVLLANEQIERAEAAELLRNAGQHELWPAEAFAQAPLLERARPVSRRRREIFAKCKGACHYCATPLRLDGSWHIEHMKPRALGGADDCFNLVAACIGCNAEKRDRTAVEFVLEAHKAAHPGRRA